jgi:hypothetical protein
MNRYYIDKIRLRNGVVQYICWNELLDYPVGILWVRLYQGEGNKRIAQLLNAMTITEERRKGVCTALHNAVLDEAEVLLSASGSNEGGKEFLKKYGFIHDNTLDIWVLTKKGA